ncbi:MAG TPA: type II toxin-antitoxin system RelE/ParE family toxin [Thermoanaerobaculia bacterium]|jgi:plasmid stabilization system protein ParE|nr:type II toxin-antitoxin system RelE/ParE family toxin [Thermoanaerobaculia bacterium]
MLQLRVGALADQQIEEADLWWRENRLKAPNAIREELERVSHLIASHPMIGARATNVALRGVRRIHIERVHYDVYYRTDGEVVEILAFWGSRRGSGPPI